VQLSRLAPNDAESATITFDTGVAQGSITSPQLFNIFMNALLRMLTATGQNQGISHGLQICKDQDDSSQDADHGYQFDYIGFIDDISIFAETPEGMQTFSRRGAGVHNMVWHGDQRKQNFPARN